MGAADVVVVVAVAVGGRLPPAEDAGAVAVAREDAGAVKPPRMTWGPTTLRETKRKFFAPPRPPNFNVQRCAQRGLRARRGKIGAATWGTNIEIGGAGAPTRRIKNLRLVSRRDVQKNAARAPVVDGAVLASFVSARLSPPPLRRARRRGARQAHCAPDAPLATGESARCAQRNWLI